ncbi:MAG TPA: serine/threonine-protein kinase [Thermoanaerobaculia bacterium]|nr:serine/threonine-protein kinase [Thermoanaerobaculia bacterium]
MEPGSHVGRFRIERPLGQGAMGNVYLAVDPEIERQVAIKIVRTDLTDSDRRDEVETRFLREAKIAGRLQHPNIVTIYDVGREGESTFIAMEYVEGRPLAKLLRPDVPLSDAQRFLIARQTAEALAHAHERQVVHRDVKPGNILIRSDGVVKVSDFGIGKLLTGGEDVTRTGMMVGSPSYMSPEQIRGDTLDGRSDIFSFGVVLYEMFTGARPFPGDTVTALVYQILHTEPRDPASIRPDLPPMTSEIIRRALAKKREERYPDARALLRDLHRAGGSSMRDSRPTPVVQEFRMPVPTPIPARTASTAGAPALAAAPAAAAVSASGSGPTVIVERRGGAALLFGIAALVLAAAAFLFVITQPRRAASIFAGVTKAAAPPAPAPPPVPAVTAPPATSASASSSVALAPPPSVPAPATSPAAAPDSAGPAATTSPESSSVGRTKDNRKTSSDSAAARPSTKTAPAVPPPITGAPEGPAPAPASDVVFDNVYHARRAMKFQFSPDQARLSVDGKYIGIADDWDDHGGGKPFPLAPGIHRLKATLPGYRDLNIQIVVAPSAPKDVESAGDEMKRISKDPFSKIPKLDYGTQGEVFFDAPLGSARVLVDGHEQGIGSIFTAAQPLTLSGPMVHDVLLTDGAKSKALRILVSSTADRNRVLIKEKLK